jgi:Family of unknown function (DUF6064)
MQLPFDARQFFEVFALYNTAVWPVQIVLWLGALAIAAVPFRSRPAGNRLIACFLGGLWLWMGVVYQLMFFRSINPAATMFGVAFLLEGGLVVAYGWQGHLRFRWAGGAAGAVAAVLIVYALVLYPVFSYILGHRYPVSPTIGLPCPTVILTLGLLALTEPPRPRVVYVIPLLWSALGATAAMQFGMWEDIALPVGAALVIGTVLLDRQVPATSIHSGLRLRSASRWGTRPRRLERYLNRK